MSWWAERRYGRTAAVAVAVLAAFVSSCSRGDQPSSADTTVPRPTHGPASPSCADAVEGPANAVERCDEAAGWRVFAWVGESGDGVVVVQQVVERSWVDRFTGPHCRDGVAAVSKSELERLGVPEDVAVELADPPGSCSVAQ